MRAVHFALYFGLPLCISTCLGEDTSGCLKDGTALFQTNIANPANAVAASSFSSSSALAQFQREDADVTEDKKDEPCGLNDFFLHHHEGPGIHKWVHYFPIYEEHFGRFCRGSDKLTMAELGIQSGGSMLMWNHAFGEKLKLLVGMDINNKTKSWEKLGSNIRVEIGDQGDANFWKNIKTKYPEGFDILLDDGSHVPEHEFVTFAHMWSAIRPGGVYLIEDLHGINPLLEWILKGHKTSAAELHGLYYPDGKVGAPDEISAMAGDSLGNFGGFPFSQASTVQNEVESIKIYPYILAITKRKTPLTVLHSQRRGSQWIPIGPAYDALNVSRK